MATKNKSYAELRREAEVWVARQVEIEREQMRQREQIRQAAAAQEEAQRKQEEAWRRQEEWNAKQEEINKRTEARLLRLEQRMELAKREIAHYKPLLDSLRERYNDLDYKVKYFSGLGLPCAGIQKERDKLYEQMYKIETKVIKAKHDKAFCEKQMSA